MGKPPATVLADLGLSYSNLHTSAADPQGVIVAGVRAAVTPSFPVYTNKKVCTNFLPAPLLCIRGGNR